MESRGNGGRWSGLKGMELVEASGGDDEGFEQRFEDGGR